MKAIERENRDRQTRRGGGREGERGGEAPRFEIKRVCMSDPARLFFFFLLQENLQ